MSRINADDNDLTWPFTVDRYPSLVYFPALDKAESISYPPHLQLTLPNLVEFVRRAAGPTADIGVCSWTCIRTNLRTTALALSRLQAERLRSLRVIYRLRCELRALFIEPLSLCLAYNSVESSPSADEVSGSISQFAASNEDTDDINRINIDTVTAGPGMTVPGTEPDDKESMHAAAEDFVTSSGLESSDIPVNRVHKDSGHGSRTSCSVERLLRVRDELATLRRHSHDTDVKRSLLRHLYTSVLVPAVVRGSGQLERRRWNSVRRCKMAAGFRLRNYRDYVSGWDVGS